MRIPILAKKVSAILLFVVLMAGYLPLAAEANHNMSFKTDKKYYIQSKENVALSLDDLGNDGAFVGWNQIAIYDSNNVQVANYDDNRQGQGHLINAGQGIDWTWDQKYDVNAQEQNFNLNGQQVPTGDYYAIAATNPLAGNGQQKTYRTNNFVVDLDSDGDGIADGADQCYLVPAQTATGCPIGGYPVEWQREVSVSTAIYLFPPDQDGDGIPDSEDNCPFASGTKTSNAGVGCPDKDAKAAAARDAAIVGGVAVASTLAGAVVAGVSTAGSGAIPAYLVLAAFETVGSVGYDAAASQRIAHDPPDPDYKIKVGLQQTPITLLQGDEYHIKLINKLFSTTLSYRDAAYAFVSANEKYMGAQQASDAYWMNVHAAEIRQYAATAAGALRQQNSALSDLQLFLSRSGANLVATRGQLADLKSKITAQGTAALPPEEINFVKNNLAGSDKEVQMLADQILSTSEFGWTEEPINQKIESLKLARTDLINALDQISANIGSNVLIGPPTADSYALQLTTMPLRVQDTPNNANLVVVGVSYNRKNYKYVGAGPAMQFDGKYLVHETYPGQLTIIFYSARGLPQGTSGDLLNLKFSKPSMTDTLMHLNIFVRPGTRAGITGVSGDAAGWLYGRPTN